MAFEWTGIGCDVCGFGSVEDVERFDPFDPCPECGDVAMPNTPWSIDVEIREPPASPLRYRNALQRAIRAERARIVALVRGMVHECPECYCEPGIERLVAYAIERGEE